MKKLLILGAGGFGRTIADVAQQIGYYDKIAFLDDTKAGMPGILGNCDEVYAFADDTTEVYPAFGNNEVRMTWMARLLANRIMIPTLVHRDAYVSPKATLGTGVVILPKAVVNTGVKIRSGCIINIGALIDHDCVIEAGCHLAPGAIVKAENRIPARCKIDSGVVIENKQYPL